MQRSPAADLPPPDEAALDHSRRCAAHLHERIAANGGSLSFAEFMQAALYAPGLGYYAAGAAKLGQAGDFVTAPEISPIFARVLARVTAEALDALGGGDILEFGAGTGRLAADLLARLAELDALPARYRILEVSPDLRERQQALLRAAVPALAPRVEWLDGLPAGHRGVMIANEVLDALPVERFRIADGVRQLRVCSAEGAFAWTDAPAPPALEAAVRQLEAGLGHPLAAGYCSEVSPWAAPWVAATCDALERGLVLLFDYGASRRELYAPDRASGWLRCHYRHRAHDDPLILPGIQDITCWVDFSAVADAALAAGGRLAGYVTQAGFLLAGGLAAELEALAPATDRERIELASQVKMLTLPGEMGERFKCLGIAKNLEPSPAALQTQDRTHTL